MAKILGLDLGTNSIGWTVVEKTGNSFKFAEVSGKPTKGVIIFPEGVKIEKGNEKSRAAERTAYRSARRLKYRRKSRKYKTLFVLSENNMCPIPILDLQSWKSSGFKEYPSNENFLNWLRTDHDKNKNPYFYRDKFSRKKYNWESNQTLAFELGRAFYHMAQRRGFKSNRLEQSDENIIANIKEQVQDTLQHCKDDTQLSEELKNTFIEYDFENRKSDELDATEKKIRIIWKHIDNVLKNKIKRKNLTNLVDKKNEIGKFINRKENLGAVKGGIKELSKEIEEAGCETLGQYFWMLYQKDRNNQENKIRCNYTAREEHYEKEFEIICDKQQISEEIKNKLYKAIFFQRPLKSQKGLVGKCTFEKNKPRCPVSYPDFEEFRMWAFINTIKIKTHDDDKLRPLTGDEKARIVPKFYRVKPRFKIKDLTKAIEPQRKFVYYKDRERSNSDYLINYSLNTTISGCPVSANLKNIMGDDWKNKTFSYSTLDANGKQVNRKVNYLDLWHILFTFEDKDKLFEYASEKLKLDTKLARSFSKIGIQQGYANLSLKAIRKITPWLKKGLIYSHAVFMANMDKVVKSEIWSNENNRKIIENAIGEIIDSHTDEVRTANAINSLVREYRGNGHVHFEDNDQIKNELTEKLKIIYGAKKWAERDDKDVIVDETFAILQKQLRRIKSKDAFLRVKRIDERIVEYLRENKFLAESKRNNSLYHPSDIEPFKPNPAMDSQGNPVVINGEQIKILPNPRTDAIKNPVVMRVMHQLRKLINELLIEGIIDNKTRINLELARELNDANKRIAWKQWQDTLRDKRENAINEIKKLYKEETGKDIEPTNDDITRYILWEEQDKREIYEDECRNISISDIIGSNPKYDIEHTIPRSVSWDNSMMNKTLCSKKFNREVKRNHIPYELDNHKDILQRIDGWKKRFLELDNEIKRINTSNVTDKETKDRLIQKRHRLIFQRDYWKGKNERFTMDEVPEGFKISQIGDTGIITRYARTYLSCLFKTPIGNSNVFVVNGQTVSEFRKAWGLQKEYERKSRENHVHHCMDAATIACMTKEKYDSFVEEWRKAEEQKEKYDVKEKYEIKKPWQTFTEDVKNLENEVLVVNRHRDNVPKQTKKKLRERGKIQYKDEDKSQPIYLQGDTARGSLHKETYYGAIKRNDEMMYVVRKKIDEFKENEINNIVDDKVRDIVSNAKKEEKQLKKEIEKLKKNQMKVPEEQIDELESQIKEIRHRIENELYVIPPKPGKDTYTPIKSVRIKAHVSEPLQDFKKQKDIKKNKEGSDKFPYKQWYYVQNDENYCLALYESDDRRKRSSEIVRLIDAAYYFKLSNMAYRIENPIVEPEKKGMKLKGLLKPGTMVIFYKDKPEEIWTLNEHELRNRLYFVKKTSKNGQVTFQFHQESRNDEQLKNDYKKQHGVDAPKSLTNGESKVDYSRLPIPKLLLSPKNMNILIEGIDFEIMTIGKIVKK